MKLSKHLKERLFLQSYSRKMCGLRTSQTEGRKAAYLLGCAQFSEVVCSTIDNNSLPITIAGKRSSLWSMIIKWGIPHLEVCVYNTGYPTRYRTRHSFLDDLLCARPIKSPWFPFSSTRPKCWTCSADVGLQTSPEIAVDMTLKKCRIR
jgi:hypothetical protein